MAGDWIKMRADLFTHPKVVRISSGLKTDSLRTVGGLMSVWCLFDAHSIDGRLSGYSSETIDEHLRWPGFSAAVKSVGWLLEDAEGLCLPRFDAHNSKTAKGRAQDSDRKRVVRNLSGSETDKNRTREEKRREDIKDTPIAPSGGMSAEDRAILDSYHAKLPRCQRIEVLNPKRKKRIAAAVKLARLVCADQGWEYKATEFWPAYWHECAGDPWMRGEVAHPTRAGWKQNLDVLIAEDRFANIMDRVIAANRGAT